MSEMVIIHWRRRSNNTEGVFPMREFRAAAEEWISKAGPAESSLYEYWLEDAPKTGCPTCGAPALACFPAGTLYACQGAHAQTAEEIAARVEALNV